MPAIEIDFDLYKALTMRRRDETHTYSDVIREALANEVRDGNIVSEQPAAPSGVKPAPARGLMTKGVLFPDGTKLRHMGRSADSTFYAEISGSKLVFDGRESVSLSDAARIATSTSVNGWRFWECCLPGSNRWVLADSLRNGTT